MRYLQTVVALLAQQLRALCVDCSTFEKVINPPPLFRFGDNPRLNNCTNGDDVDVGAALDTVPGKGVVPGCMVRPSYFPSVLNPLKDGPCFA